MKTTFFSPLKRFLSMLILDEDIAEQKNIQKPDNHIHPLFLQVKESSSTPITIQPEEIGGIENIDTRIF